MPLEDAKPVVEPPTKSSMEILSELFSTFDAEPPVIVKKEAHEELTKKHKKSKKKRKHKDKKHKKKSKKRKHSVGDSSDNAAVDLTDVLIKKEKQAPTTESEGTYSKDTLETTNKETIVKSKGNLLDNSTFDEFDLDSSKKNKIVIKELKFSSIFDATILAIKEKEKLRNTEDGELSQSELTGDEGSEEDLVKGRAKREKHKRKHKHRGVDEKSKKRKHSHRSRSREHSKKRSRSCSGTRKRERDKTPEKLYGRNHQGKDKHKAKSKERDGKGDQRSHKFREHDNYKSRERDNKSRDRDDYKSKERSDCRRSKEREDYEDRKRKCKDSFYNTDAHNNSDKDDKWFMKDRYRGYTDRDRERERRFREKSEENADYIDKKKLLEIARKNAIQMMKSGSLPGALTLGPQAQEKVIAAIKSGGKTVEELTDFCKTLSKKEELGELSSISEDNVSESDGEKPFHHPFLIKERPVSITMNIKNSVPLPIKNSQERASELRIQFPVSSGQQHRKTENEWVPVPPKKNEVPSVKPAPTVTMALSLVPAPLSIQAPPPPPPPQPAIIATTIPLPAVPAVIPTAPVPQMFSTTSTAEQNIDIAAIVSQRLSAMRKLQENPNDVQALNVMYKAQKEMNCWAESKQQVGQFTGTTGAHILTQAELAAGYQAWARKDQLQTAAPVSGGMGMHLLQKMGWKPGEGLGKEKTGALEPLLLEVKLDKKGIVAKEEQKKKQVPKVQKPTVKTLQGKHPVSLLGEYASKHKLGAPQYDLCFECGPDHKKNFLFRVILNGAEYKPQVASPNKKEAKAHAAMLCLQQLGILPSAL